MKQLTLIMIALLTSFLFSCSNKEQKSQAYGNFEAIDILVSSELAGKINYLKVEEGSQIDSNSIIAAIDTMQLHYKKMQLIAQKSVIGAKTPNIVSQINVLKEQRAVAQIEKDRLERLFKDNAATQKQLDDINGNLKVINKQIEAIETQNAPILGELNNISSQIDQIQDQINRSIIKSPIKGVIINKYVEQGEIIAPGKPMIKIANLDFIELRAFISGSQLASIKLGQKVKVSVDEDKNKNREIEGEITWISSKAEFTPKLIQTKEERVNMVYAIKAKVKNDGLIKIGMPGEINF